MYLSGAFGKISRIICAWADMPGKKYYIFGKETGQRFAEQLDVPLLGQIPMVEKIAESGDHGTPLALDADSPVTKAFDEIAKAVMEH